MAEGMSVEGDMHGMGACMAGRHASRRDGHWRHHKQEFSIFHFVTLLWTLKGLDFESCVGRIPWSSFAEVTDVFDLQPVVTLVLSVSVDAEAVEGVEADLDFAVGRGLWTIQGINEM